jgi:purine-binding chemotaxis protein CheW
MPEFAPSTLKTIRNDIPLLTFRLGQQDYALPVDDVVEVAAMVEMTHIAGTMPGLPGIVNRHGKPLHLIDLRSVFEQPTPAVTVATLFIVAQHDDYIAGLIVDEVLLVEYLPVTGRATGAIRYIREIISQNARLIQVVSLAALLKAYLPDASEVE